jgi:hypothetical protein
LDSAQDILERLGGSALPAPARLGAPVPHLTLTPSDLGLLVDEPSLLSPATAVLWLRGPVEVPQMPTQEHDRLYDKVKSMCCILHDIPSRECVDRDPGAQLVPS